MKRNSLTASRKLLSRKMCIHFAGCAAAVCTSLSAQAQSLNWNNAAGGSAGTAANWNPAQIPGAASILNFNLAGNYAVSFPATVPTSSQMNLSGGTISLSMLSPHTATAQFVVGLNAASTPNVSLTSGSLSAPIIVVGSGAGSTSVLNLSSVSSDLFSTGANGTRIGSTGNGTLNITGGGSLRSNGAVTLALQAGSQGTVLVSGLSGTTRSELVTLDPVNGDLFVAQNGPGSLNITAGGRVDIADDAFIAPTATFVGSTTVGSATASFSVMNVTGDMHIGHNTSASAAGTGTLNVNDGSVVQVIGDTFVGDSAGGTGTLAVRLGGTFYSRSLTIDPSHGNLNHSGGDIFLQDGVLTAPNNQLTVNGSVSARLFMQNESSTLSAVLPAHALVVGSTGMGFMDVGTFSSLDVTSGNVVLADSAGSDGTMQVQISSTLSIAPSGMFTIGNAGEGHLNVAGNGHVISGPVQLGLVAGGTGVAAIQAPGSAFDIAGSLALGGSMTAFGGVASMTIGSGLPDSGTVSVLTGSGPGVENISIWPGSLLTINAGGTLVSDRQVLSRGAITLAGGTIDANNVVPSLSGPYSFTGVIVGLLQPNGGAVVNLTGPLSVGGLRNDATINVGSHTLTIPQSVVPTARFIGNCTIGSSGHIVAPDGLTLSSGKVLSGSGTIDADIENHGTIAATGVGLTVNGMITGVGQGVGGTAITFGSGGGFTGGGDSIDANVNALAGSTIHARLSTLILGNAASSTGFASAGQLIISSGLSMILRDLDGVTVKNVELASGLGGPPWLISPSGIAVNGLVTGTGSLDAFSEPRQNQIQLSFNAATISPGEGTIPGIVYLNGDSRLDAASRVEFDVLNANFNDQIRTVSNSIFSPTLHAVASDITLGGTLVLRVAPDHVPTSGESHLLLATNRESIGPDGAVNGNFSSLEVPRHWLIKVIRFENGNEENGVYAVYCTADFNEDGTADFFDYLDFVDDFSAGRHAADFNNDSIIDFFDYLDFVDAFSTGC